MSVVDASLDALRAALAAGGRHVDGIWLFGSWARGDAGAGSDVDLGVLCDPPLGLERPAVMDRVAAAVGCDVDVVDLASAPPPLVWEIVTTGRLVLELNEEAVERFVRRARHAAEDDEQRARMILLAQVGAVGGAEA